jgi:hypothetical protein
VTNSILERFAHLLAIPRLLPTRRIVTRSGARVRGIFPSYRFGKGLHWEADLERRLLYRLEASQRVTEACTQPLTVSIPCDGRQFRVHAGCPHRRSLGCIGLCRVQAAGGAQGPDASRSPGSHRPAPPRSRRALYRGHGRQSRRSHRRAELLAARHRSLRQDYCAGAASKPSRDRNQPARSLWRTAVIAWHSWRAQCARAWAALRRHPPATRLQSAADIAARGER